MAQGNRIPQKMPDRAVQNFTTKKNTHKRPRFYIKEIVENIFGSFANCNGYYLRNISVFTNDIRFNAKI